MRKSTNESFLSEARVSASKKAMIGSLSVLATSPDHRQNGSRTTAPISAGPWLRQLLGLLHDVMDRRRRSVAVAAVRPSACPSVQCLPPRTVGEPSDVWTACPGFFCFAVGSPVRRHVRVRLNSHLSPSRSSIASASSIGCTQTSAVRNHRGRRC